MDGLQTRHVWPGRDGSGQVAPPRSGNRYALVVGVDAYDERFFRRLKYATEDAKAIADCLENDFRFKITKFLDDQAKRAAIRDVLERWRTETEPGDDVLFFFAGHGTNHPEAARRDEGYLVPVEANNDPESWLAEAELIEWAGALPAQRVFLVLDACYAGSALRVSTVIPPGEEADKTLEILVAGTEDQPVLDGGAGVHSIFTKALLDGLAGLADTGQNPDGTLTDTELIAFAQSEVPWRSRMLGRKLGNEQTPVGGPLHGARKGAKFQFVPSRPRLPASLLRNLFSRQVEDRKSAIEQLRELRGTDRADLAADELIRLATLPPPAAGYEEMTEADLSQVRQAAATSLGVLGHPKGFSVLTKLLDPQQPAALEAAAASALGVLAENPEERAGYDVAELQGEAIGTLLDALGASDGEVHKAAKEGLSRLPAASERLRQELEHKSTQGRRRKELLEILAWLGDRYPNDERSWPALQDVRSRFWRRIYLARRRISPRWPDLLRQAGLVGLFGAIGMGLAFLFVMLAIHWNYRWLYGSAVLSLNALPGLLAGACFVVLPHLARGLARGTRDAADTPGAPAGEPGLRMRLLRWLRRDTAGTLGVLAGGLLLGVWMGIPHAFWGVGSGVGGCPPYLTWLCQALPGLVTGPIVGLALVRLPWRAPAARTAGGTPAGSRLGNVPWILLVTAISGLMLAALKIPQPLSFRALDPHGVEVLLWGVGGALFGAALAVGWSLTLQHEATSPEGEGAEGP